MPKPIAIELYLYNVFFGDCFLLVFQYDDGTEKFVLIDFGSTGKGKLGADEADENNEESTGSRLLKIAKHVQERCNGSLDIVVATHRHKDHIYGFGLKEAGKIIASCKPKAVIQPWTEDPDDIRDLSKQKPKNGTKVSFADERTRFAKTLSDMGQVAKTIEAETKHLGDSDKFIKTINPELQERIILAADDNQVKNRAAVDNLRGMGPNHYVYFGYDKIEWDELLPGIGVDILGPPSLEQSDKILGATNESDEFWSLKASTNYFWGTQAATSSLIETNIDKSEPIFGKEKAFNKWVPPNVRWFIRQLRNLRANQLFELVKYVDNAINNTSVILLFNVGDQTLLFPGDAQIENWKYALSMAEKDPRLSKLLENTTLYKVGHHGSRNATPKTLWKNFVKKSADPDNKQRLQTAISTMKGKHGESEDTYVPLPKLVQELKAQSVYSSTEEIKDGFVEKIYIEIAR